VFKLGGAVRLPPVGPLWQHTPPPPPDTADAATITAGFELFAQFCLPCHGVAAVGGGVVPDLRKSPFLPVDAFYNIVLDGILKFNGMADFGAVLDRPAVTAIRAYIIRRANEDRTASAPPKPRQPDVNRGAVIAAQGTAAGAPACALCHAFNGGSDGSGAFPRIAWQRGERGSRLRKLPRSGRSWAVADDPVPRRTIRALHFLRAEDVAARLPQDQ
jgi:mono/diheme cytochrome c family protein